MRRREGSLAGCPHGLESDLAPGGLLEGDCEILSSPTPGFHHAKSREAGRSTKRGACGATTFPTPIGKPPELSTAPPRGGWASPYTINAATMQPRGIDPPAPSRYAPQRGRPVCSRKPHDEGLPSKKCLTRPRERASLGSFLVEGFSSMKNAGSWRWWSRREVCPPLW